MNRLKTLFDKVFETTPPADTTAAPKEETVFEWNPDEGTVGSTSSRSTSWKRGEVTDVGRKHLPAEAKASAVEALGQSLPAPLFEKGAVAPAPVPEPSQAGVEIGPLVSAKLFTDSAPVAPLETGMPAPVVAETPAFLGVFLPLSFRAHQGESSMKFEILHPEKQLALLETLIAVLKGKP